MTLCTKFQPNVFNKTKCQNCFKPKELHSARALECCHTARCITRCGFMFVAPEQYDFNNPSDKSRRWQRRFVVLYDDGELRYSVDDNVSTIPQGTIDMTQCLDIEQDAEPITSHKLSMSITLKDKTTYIRAGNKDERNRWYEVLSVYVKPKRINGRVYGTAAIPSNIYASANSNKSEPTICSAPQAGVLPSQHTTYRCVRHLKSHNRHARSLSLHDLNTTWKDRSLSPPPHESNNKTNETDEYKISKSSESLRSNLANDSSGIAKTGWLVIMSGNNKEGDKRWFLLQANKLHYHIDSDSSSKKMGMFDLKLAYNVVESNISRNYGFKVETQHGDILLSAMTSQIRTSWMTALRSQIPRRSSNASSTTSSYTSAWPYTPKILADSEEMIYNVEEMMERRAKNRGLRSKSLVYPPSSGAAAAASSRKDRDRRLTEINAASATSAATNPSSANPASTNPAISSATAATAQLPTSRTEPPPLISDYRTSANKTANMQTDSDLIKNLQAEVQNLKQRIDKSCLCNNKNCEQDIVKLKSLNHAATAELDACRSRGSSLTRALASSQEQTLQERERLEQHSASSERRLQLIDEECRDLRQQLCHLRESADRDCEQLRAEMYDFRDAHADEMAAIREQHRHETAERLAMTARDQDQLREEMRGRAMMFEDARQRYEDEETRLRQENDVVRQRADLADRSAQQLDERLTEAEDMACRCREEYEQSREMLERRIDELNATLKNSELDLADAKQELSNATAALNKNEKALQTALQNKSATASEPANNKTKSMTALEIDYEVKLGEMNDKLAVATRKLQNMDRRINRNQRCQSLDSPVPAMTTVTSVDNQSSSLLGCPIISASDPCSVESLKRRVISLEKDRLSPSVDLARLRAISHQTYTSADEVLADLRRVLQSSGQPDNVASDELHAGEESPRKEEQDTTAVEEDSVSRDVECYRIAYCEQLVRENLVLGKLAASHPRDQESKPEQSEFEQQYHDCSKLLIEAFAYLETIQSSSEEFQLQDVSTFICGQLMLIGDMCPSDLPARPIDASATASLSSSLAVMSQLLTGQTHGNILLSLDTFCYRACSILSVSYESLRRTPSQYELRCRGRLVDDRLYTYLSDLFEYRLQLCDLSTPICLRDQADCADKFRQDVESWSTDTCGSLLSSFETVQLGLAGRVRLAYERACHDTRLRGVEESARLDKERLKNSESLVAKLDGEIKRLWRLVDQNDANSNRDDEIKKIKDIYEDELRLAACEHQRQLADSDQLHVQQLEDQRVLLEEESLAAQDAISALKQQHRVEISHFNDIVNDLQTIDVDCVHQKLQEENLALQEELTKAENHLINRDNECMALKERIGQQLSDLHASRKRVQDLIQRNDQLNDKLSDDIASLMIMVDDKRSVQVTGTIEDITLELKLKEEQIWQLNEDLVSRSSELQDTTKELETTIEMFHELHKQHNDMQDNLNLEIQQLRVQLYLRPPSTDDDLSEDEIDNRSHSLTSNLSPVGRKQLWRMDREESDRGKNQTSNE